MKAYTYIRKGELGFVEKEKPVLLRNDSKSAIVKVTLGSICSSDLHIRNGAVPKAKEGITLGHEMVGIIETTGSEVCGLKPGDRVVVNCETICGECWYCQRGHVNNCEHGGWLLGCQIDGGQAQWVKVPYAEHSLTKIPDSVSDEQALFVGDILSTGFWATRISNITKDDTVFIIGGGPVGICTLECVLLKSPDKIIISEADPKRRRFIKKYFPQVIVTDPEHYRNLLWYVCGGYAPVVIDCAGGSDQDFEMALDCTRPGGRLTIVAMYENNVTLPLPSIYGKNLTIKFGGVDGTDCEEILSLIEQGKLDTTMLITHRYSFRNLKFAYELFEGRKRGVMKIVFDPRK